MKYLILAFVLPPYCLLWVISVWACAIATVADYVSDAAEKAAKWIYNLPD